MQNLRRNKSIQNSSLQISSQACISKVREAPLFILKTVAIIYLLYSFAINKKNLSNFWNRSIFCQR